MGQNYTGPQFGKYAIPWSVTDDARRQRASLVCPPALYVGGPVTVLGSIDIDCKQVSNKIWLSAIIIQ